MRQKKLIFNFFVNRNRKKLGESRKRPQILADNRKTYHSIENPKQISQKNCLSKAKRVVRAVALTSFNLRRKFYNLALCTRHFCSVYPFLLSDSRLCRFPLNFASLDFYIQDLGHSSRSGRVFSGSRILPKDGAEFGKTQNILTRNRTQQNLRTG